MAFIRKKIINEKERFYLERSVRLPTGKIKKYSVYLSNYPADKDTSEQDNRLNENIKISMLDYAIKQYKKSGIYDETVIKKIEEAKLEYKEIIKKLTKKQFNDILDRFTANFTYESNAIEGNSLTLKDVTIIIHERILPKNKDLREIYETLNTRDAIEEIFRKKIKIKKEDIIKLHKILIKNTGVTPGFKKIPNFLLGRNIKTTPPERVEREIDELLEWYHKNKEIHPLMRAVIFHGRFEKIHPFEDGNGRTGRLLVNAILINNDYPPLIIRKTQRIAYFSALEAFDNGYETKLHRFLLEKYKETNEKFFKIYVKYLSTSSA